MSTANLSPLMSLPLLANLRIASPCPMRWEDLAPTGSAHTRHCDRCRLKVHNLSGMTGEEAEALLRSGTGEDGAARRVCVGFYRRADGTVLTADCPVGVAALRAKARRAVARAAAAVGLTAVVSWVVAREAPALPFARVQPLTALANALRGDAVTPLPVQRMVLGDPCPAVAQPAGPVIRWLQGAEQ